MYKQKREITMTEGDKFPDNAEPGDIHAMRVVDCFSEKGFPRWEIYHKRWCYPAWQFIENISEVDFLKYYGYSDDVKLKPFERFHKHGGVTK